MLTRPVKDGQSPRNPQVQGSIADASTNMGLNGRDRVSVTVVDGAFHRQLRDA